MYVESSAGATTIGAPANHGRVEFVVGSRLALGVFSGFSGLRPSPPSGFSGLPLSPPSTKSNISK